jgi:hypothetical protein
MSKKHPHKDIRDAIKYALENGWALHESKSSSHSWGILRCPNNDPNCRCGEFCSQSIWCTPKNPSNHAKQIKRIIDNCIYQKDK